MMDMNNTYFIDDTSNPQQLNQMQHLHYQSAPLKQLDTPYTANVYYKNPDQLNSDNPFGEICKNAKETSNNMLNIESSSDLPDSNCTNFASSNNIAETTDSNFTINTNETYTLDPAETQQFDPNYYTIKTNYDESPNPQITNGGFNNNNGYNLFTSFPQINNHKYYYQSPFHPPSPTSGMGFYDDMYQITSPNCVGMPMSLPASPYISCSRSPAQSIMGDYDTDSFMLNTMQSISMPNSPCYGQVYNNYGQFLMDSIPQFTLTQSAINVNSNGMNSRMGVVMNANKLDYENFDESFYAIVDEIVENVKYLPPKNSEVKCSLDSNHPIHCVWKDMNRGHFSWRCRWWENGKRLSKNFNIKRFGDLEAMRMAITMKLKNSTPSERLQLLKEQREVVRVNMEKQAACSLGDSLAAVNSQQPSPVLTGHLPSPNLSGYSGDDEEYSVTIQDENFSRLSWAYTMLNRHPNNKDSSLKCKICRKTVKTYRGKNIEQSFFLHLFRMHKNPWRQYVDDRGLDEASKDMLNNLYSFHGINDRTPWKVNSSLCRP